MGGCLGVLTSEPALPQGLVRRDLGGLGLHGARSQEPVTRAGPTAAAKAYQRDGPLPSTRLGAEGSDSCAGEQVNRGFCGSDS